MALDLFERQVTVPGCGQEGWRHVQGVDPHLARIHQMIERAVVCAWGALQQVVQHPASSLAEHGVGCGLGSAQHRFAIGSRIGDLGLGRPRARGARRRRCARPRLLPSRTTVSKSPSSSSACAATPCSHDARCIASIARLTRVRSGEARSSALFERGSVGQAVDRDQIAPFIDCPQPSRTNMGGQARVARLPMDLGRCPPPDVPTPAPRSDRLRAPEGPSSRAELQWTRKNPGPELAEAWPTARFLPLEGGGGEMTEEKDVERLRLGR